MVDNKIYMLNTALLDSKYLTPWALLFSAYFNNKQKKGIEIRTPFFVGLVDGDGSFQVNHCSSAFFSFLHVFLFSAYFLISKILKNKHIK